MTFYPDERIAIIIDGANLYSTVKTLDFDLDYQKLLELFRNKGKLQRAYYYTALIENEDYSPLRPLDHFLLFSGDGDFKAVIEAVQKQGCRVSVISTLKSKPPMLADELRRQADNFIELADLDKLIGRPKSSRDWDED